MNKLVWKWSISYFCIMMIPILFGGLLYLYALNSVQNKSEEMHRLLAEERHDIIAKTCEELDESANRLLASVELEQILNKRDHASASYYYWKMQDILVKSIAESDVIEEIVLYFPQMDSLLSSSWLLSASEETDLFEKRMRLSSEYFYWMLSGDIYNQLKICDTFMGDQNLLFIRSLSEKKTYQDQKVILIYNVNERALENLLAMEGINFYLEELDGDCYAILSEDEYITVEGLQKLEIENREMIRIENECIYFSYLDSYQIGLYNVQHDVDFVRENRNMILFLMGYCVLCIVIGFVLTYLQSRKHYQPVDHLVRLLEKSGEELDKNDTWASLQNSVKNLSVKYREGILQQRESNRLMDEITLRQVLLTDRSFRYTDFYKRTEGYQRACYLVAGIDILETGEGYQEIVKSRNDIQMFHFVIDNVVSELLEDICIYQTTTIDDEFYALISYDNTVPEIVQEIRNRFKKVCDFFESSYAIKLFVNISEHIWDTDHVSDGLKEVQYLTQYRNEFGSDQKVLVFDEAEKENDTYQSYIRQCRTKITVLRLVRDDMLEETAAVLQKMFPPEETREKKTLVKKRQKDDLIESILDFISKNYSNPQMTAGYVADAFEVDISKLSKEFKIRFGTGVLEYIGKVRLEEAKKLLHEGRNVGETALAVGYYNSRPLIRLFQEHEGMSPSQFAKGIK